MFKKEIKRVDVKVYTVEEFAKAIKRNRGAVYKLAKKGLITPKYTITGRPYYTDEDVKKFYGITE